jgi:acid phosphatase
MTKWQLSRFGLAGLLLGAVTACATQPADERLHSTLWVQTSAEYAVASFQVFSLAAAQADAAIADPEWTALPDVQSREPDLPIAVITDVDETILDNSAFTARNILADRQYTGEAWDRWVSEQGADAVPGAVRYLDWLANQRGVTVFYVTRRKAMHEAATRGNLAKLGFPLSATEDTLLMDDERPGWGSQKNARRQEIASRYRVIQIFGDNLSDFMDVPSTASPATRLERARDTEPMWGTRWFLIPNPIYGDWETSLMDGLDPATREAEALRRKLGGLEPY